ncbi:MAG: hypothetical protein KJ620_02705 [Candidatus Edwardsbacteria bacterium]|nr:hypothetical protein [Candidatus Edwardsbacteria bacterium]MBU1576945.1 hypothetical protein [Candidatus Edwardsbacteria bacterium]MBU2463311.1 hypothetical protein [Candidatus Edwardsbacteria bacterium]MBU2593740.1 hypothetical protein [Candidatus Edwardsbacteria bacterium]
MMTIFCLILLQSCGTPPEGTVDSEAIDIKGDPVQLPLEDQEPIKITVNGYDITLKPKAEYILKGLVLGRKNYGSDWNSTIAPCDLAVAWDKMTTTGLYKYVKWSQGNRWYYWRYDEEFPFDNAFIARYSANTHAIPANQNIRAALLHISSGDTVEAYGFLVYVDAVKGESNFWWNSSLSREDVGNGSCEVMYIEEIKYRGMLYK